MRDVFAGNLTTGKTRSCGHATWHRVGADAPTYRHGLSHTPIWRVWTNMKTRCLNPKSKSFPDYGGRGIAVCDRWMTSVENFLADMGHPPPGMSLDRIDTNGDYEPSNCRWATKPQQARNTRRNVFLSVGDHTLTVSQWAERTGTNRRTIEARLRRGLPPEAAVASVRS